MTEQEWMAATDPEDMLLEFANKLSVRKRRLFGAACVRRVWPDLPYDELRQAVETCERFADGLCATQQIQEAQDEANRLYEGIGDIVADHSCLTVAAICTPTDKFSLFAGTRMAAVAAEASSDGRLWNDVQIQEQRAQCDLLRHISGNPFRPYPCSMDWPAGIVNLANSLYHGADCSFALHDALLDAGHPELAEHFRVEQAHPKGCWILDLIMGKE